MPEPSQRSGSTFWFGSAAQRPRRIASMPDRCRRHLSVGPRRALLQRAMVAFLQEAAPSADRTPRFLDLYVMREARSVPLGEMFLIFLLAMQSHHAYQPELLASVAPESNSGSDCVRLRGSATSTACVDAGSLPAASLGRAAEGPPTAGNGGFSAGGRSVGRPNLTVPRSLRQA